jgi:N-acetyl-gamma-glutamyl-phosphate reductase
MIKVGIIGGAGYTGGELLRILVNHADVKIDFVNSKSNLGKHISVVHQDLVHIDLAFSDKFTGDVDVIFLCAGHGEAIKYLSEYTPEPKTKIIDLSNDFRLSPQNIYQNREFVYGLPEANLHKIKTANNIANPGCFATCIQLGLLPLAKVGALTKVYTTAITGSTGAGQSLSNTGHFSWRSNNIQAYKTLSHQHVGEITQMIDQLQGQSKFKLNFVPWRGDFTRGIFASTQLETTMTIDQLNDLYQEFYKDAKFTFVAREPVHLKQVVNTNNALIQIEQQDTTVVVHSVIDNLLKGASGQAVQNMNILFGLEQDKGLKLKASMF